MFHVSWITSLSVRTVYFNIGANAMGHLSILALLGLQAKVC